MFGLNLHQGCFHVSRRGLVINRLLQGCLCVSLLRRPKTAAAATTAATAAAASTPTTTAKTTASAADHRGPRCHHCGNLSRDGIPFGIIGHRKVLAILVQHSLLVEAPAATPTTTAAATTTTAATTATTAALGHQTGASQPQRGNTAGQDHCFLQYVHNTLLFLFKVVCNSGAE